MHLYESLQDLEQMVRRAGDRVGSNVQRDGLGREEVVDGGTDIP